MNSLPSLDSAMLAQLQESVARALTETTAREQALAGEPPAAFEAGVRQKMHACEQRLGEIETHANRAADELREMDGLLAQNEEELRRFLTSAEDLRRGLAEWTGRAIA